MEAIDGCLLALTLGATFVARSFSGDKGQLVPILKAGLAHKDLRSWTSSRPASRSTITKDPPRATPTRAKNVEVVQADFVAPQPPSPQCDAGSVRNVMLHDGSWVRLRKVAEDYEPTDRDRSCAYIRDRQKDGEIVTGLLYISPDSADMHEQIETVAAPLTQLPFEELCPGGAELEKLQKRFR